MSTMSWMLALPDPGLCWMEKRLKQLPREEVVGWMRMTNKV